MRTEELDWPLPPEAIAQVPVEPRDAARLLVGPDVLADASAGVSHRHVRDLPSLLRPGDLVVMNSTRVLAARVPVRRDGGGTGEVLLVHEADDGWWEALCRPSRRLSEGTVVQSVDGELAIEMGGSPGEGRRLVRPIVADRGELLDRLATAGEMPLPPYITADLEDPERYQTTYARRPASAAAPTAGLHLTPGLLAALDGAGVQRAEVELVVGLDTFRPVTAERLEDHVIHREHYAVSDRTWDAVVRTRAAGARVVAVGTTTVRALESRATGRGAVGLTDLFITPGYRFEVVDLLLTNFHLPRSSLLAMVEAFCGPGWRDLYAVAIEAGYRFLSFGDAMLVARADAGKLVARADAGNLVARDGEGA